MGGGNAIIEFMKTAQRFLLTITHTFLGILTFLTLTPIVQGSAVPIPDADRDRDNDGLIEINTLAKLHRIRYDLDGDGSADTSSNEDKYNELLGSTLTNSGCPSTGCIGYELIADLDFDTNGDGSVDGDDDYHNSGDGWLPIGDGTNTFNATFHGNGHTISNLTIDRSTSHWGGLFGELGADAVVRNLGLNRCVSKC